MWCVEAETKAGSLGYSVVVLASGPNDALGKAVEKYPEIFGRSRGGKLSLVSHVYLDWVEGRFLVIEKAPSMANCLQPKQ